MKEMLIVQKKDAKPQTMWTPMTKKVLSEAENTIGLKDRQQHITSNEIRTLSQQLKKQSQQQINKSKLS